jgi:hypothetical protein
MNSHEHFNREKLGEQVRHHSPTIKRVLSYACSHLQHYPHDVHASIRDKDLAALKAKAAYLRQTALSCALPVLEARARHLESISYFDRAAIERIEAAIEQEIAVVLPLLEEA